MMKHAAALWLGVAAVFVFPATEANAAISCFKSGDALDCSGVDDSSGAPINLSGTVTDGSGTLTGNVGDTPVSANATPAGNSILISGSFDGGQITGECTLSEDGTTCI